MCDYSVTKGFLDHERFIKEVKFVLNNIKFHWERLWECIEETFNNEVGQIDGFNISI